MRHRLGEPVLQGAAIRLVLQGVVLQEVVMQQVLVELGGVLEVEVLGCRHLLRHTRSSLTSILVPIPSTPQFLLRFLPPLKSYPSFPTARLVKNMASLPTPSKL